MTSNDRNANMEYKIRANYIRRDSRNICGKDTSDAHLGSRNLRWIAMTEKRRPDCYVLPGNTDLLSTRKSSNPTTSNEAVIFVQGKRVRGHVFGARGMRRGGGEWSWMWLALFVGGVGVCGPNGWKPTGGWVWRWLSGGFDEYKIYTARDGYISQYRPCATTPSFLRLHPPPEPFSSRTHSSSLSFGGSQTASFCVFSSGCEQIQYSTLGMIHSDLN
ncbi:hypothetical protein BDQ17DRAFT_1368191 [Cyathus striatus]|nr:hypothetical protein BDQ17DRAFT_1368191 [Cyathus striatus]